MLVGGRVEWRDICVLLALCWLHVGVWWACSNRFAVADDVVNDIESINVYKDQDLRTGYATLLFILVHYLYNLCRSLKLAITRFLLENITREKPNVAQFYLGLISDFDEPDLSNSNCFNAILAKLSGIRVVCFQCHI